MAGMRMAAPLLALRNGQSEAAVGVLLSCFALTQIFLSIPAGRYADRHGFKRPMMLGVLVASLGTLERDNPTRYILDLSLPKRPDGKYAIAKMEVTFDPGTGKRETTGLVPLEMEYTAAGHGYINAEVAKQAANWLISELFGALNKAGKDLAESPVTPEKGAELLALIDRLNADPAVHGILVQLPLPGHLNSELVINRIDPAKDVDGFHISNVGLLGTGQKSMVPCTPLGCLMMLRDHHGKLAGLNAVVVGRSNIVGKPMAQLLLGDSCTVTIAHSRTKDLAEVCRRADILVAAVGRPEMITGDMVKPGATVIDVGINRIERDGKAKLVGDVDYESAAAVAGAITPVPGGVGPMTIACLLANTLTACCRANGLAEPEGLTA